MATTPTPQPNETQQLQAQPPVVDTQVVQTPSSTPQQANREEIYNRYYQQQQQPVEPQQPVQQAPTPQEPTTPSTPQLPPEVLQTLTSLTNKITELEGRLAAPQVSTPTPAATPEQGWFDLLREGKIEEAEKLLTKRVQEAVQPSAVQNASTEALDALRAEVEISSYLTNLRSQNPEIVPMERYLRGPVEARLNEARNAGKIKTNADFIREYKSAVETEVEEARKLVLQLRGAGKQDGLTVKREVLNATTLAPSQVDREGQGSPQQQGQPETIDDYFAKRQQQSRQIRRLA